MRQVIGLVLLGLICSNVVVAGDETQADGASQSGRIVNGIGVNIANYRYALNMYYNNQFICGASVITASHALTAGQCVQPVMTDIKKVVVHGGSTSPTTGGFFFQVIRIALHSGYNPNSGADTSEFDVAVLQVAKNAFRGKPNIAPIELQIREVPVDTTCYVVGWGRTYIARPAPNSDLQYAKMNIMSQARCAASWALYTTQKVTSNMICAMYGSGVDVCKGDTGGALVCGGRLTGIISFTNPACSSAGPSVFTKVIAPSIRKFIHCQAGI